MIAKSPMGSVTSPPTRHIHVLREDARIDAYPLWFNIPDAIWRELYLATWDRAMDAEGDTPRSDADDAAYVRGQYAFPVCLIY